jgi:hypothetical protein
VTTGTIRAQGSQYRLFTDKHFPTLVEIFKQVLEHLEINATCTTGQQNNAETCVKLPVTPDNVQDNTDTCPKLPLRIIFAIDELQAFTASSILDESINVTFSSFFYRSQKAVFQCCYLIIWNR